VNKLELGQKIRALRKERKQTLETLAEAADIGLVYLGEIERGIKMPAAKRPRIQADSMNTIRIRRRNAKHGRLRIFCRAFRLA